RQPHRLREQLLDDVEGRAHMNGTSRFVHARLAALGRAIGSPRARTPGYGLARQAPRALRSRVEEGAEEEVEGGLGPAAVLGAEGEQVHRALAVVGVEPGGGAFDR